MIKFGIVGLGRIGKLHLKNICTQIEGAEIKIAMNPAPEGKKFAKKFHIPIITSDPDVIFNDPEIQAVIISSPTPTHLEYILKAARSGIAIFCEKPMDLSLNRVRDALKIVKKSRIPLMIGFNQRFDSNFSSIKKIVDDGKIGKIHTLHIVSRDPAPPPLEYIRHSGGMFIDMTIHDFDMARYIIGCEPVEVYAKGYNLINPAIGRASDIDTGIVIITFENYSTAIIENSRKSVYGYDQRMEVFGFNGMAKAGNPLKHTGEFYNQNGALLARHLDFFMDRYAMSYKAEIEAFIDALIKNKPMPVSGEDGLKAMIIADAANRSMRDGKPVKLKFT